jgi:8-oxo-dGTP pyrophosphatase MutT (NUDIX family)
MQTIPTPAPPLPHSPPRDSATVVLLRDTPQGPEVFLARRHTDSDVLGGAYVFPGGKLDASDLQLDAHLYLDSDVQALHTSLAEPDLEPLRAQGLYVAAVREVFEEAGVLFGQALTAEQGLAAMQMLRAGHDFNATLAQLQLRLDTRALRPYSRWITPLSPSMGSKRFDTRFFVAALPAGQSATHDAHETTESIWLRPRAALEQYVRGTMVMAPPQTMTLAHLARFGSVAEVLQHCQTRPPALVFPQAMLAEDGQRILCYPGDALHDIPDRALPGPTRLVQRGRRFEPEAGFEAWFA